MKRNLTPPGASAPPRSRPSARAAGNPIIVLDPVVLGITLGILVGLALFVATNVLIIKGGSQVGAHLALLNQFFYGYTVTLRGSFIGLVYGFGCGFVSGWIVATVYNWVASLRKR